MRMFLITALSLLLAGGASLPHASAAEIVLSGSTTFQKRVLEAAGSAAEKKIGAAIVVRGVGSIKGLKELMKGDVAGAILSLPLEMAFKETGAPAEGTYEEHVVMKDTIVPIVHPMNPVTSLSRDQLVDILTGRITNWKAVGGQDSRIVVVAAPRGSGTRRYLQDALMNDANYADGSFTAVATREEVDIVSRSQVAIGVLSEAFLRNSAAKVKVLKIRSKPITRQLSIVTKNTPSPELAALIAFLRSPQGKKLLR